MTDGVEAYPLHWPAGWPRTKYRERARFRTHFVIARDELFREIQRLGARAPILSSNLALRRDGLPYAVKAQPDDPGVALYFQYKKRPMCFACDRWDRVQDNVQALCLTIGAIRGIERWSASDMLDRAFTGFEALPAPGQKQHWRAVLGFTTGETVTKELVDRRAKELASINHPDHGGDATTFAAVMTARNEARKELLDST